MVCVAARRMRRCWDRARRLIRSSASAVRRCSAAIESAESLGPRAAQAPVKKTRNVVARSAAFLGRGSCLFKDGNSHVLGTLRSAHTALRQAPRHFEGNDAARGVFVLTIKHSFRRRPPQQQPLGLSGGASRNRSRPWRNALVPLR